MKEMVEYIKENNIPYFFIAGDLYEQDYIKKSTVEYVNQLFTEIPNTKIFITPGNHDPYIKNSFYKQFKWNENVHIFTNEIEVVEDENVDIYGYGFNDFYMAKKSDPIHIKNKQKINILITHGSLDSGIDENREYAIQLNEKQKVKFVYGILEKQFHMYYEKASRMPGKTGENLLTLIERRLDNVVYRLGFAMTRREARQLTTHGHFTVNGQRVDIPSYLVKAGDMIEVKESSRSSAKFKRLTGEDAPTVLVPKWLERDKNALKGTVVQMPAREDIDLPVEEHLIVELYSK